MIFLQIKQVRARMMKIHLRKINTRLTGKGGEERASDGEIMDMEDVKEKIYDRKKRETTNEAKRRMRGPGCFITCMSNTNAANIIIVKFQDYLCPENSLPTAAPTIITFTNTLVMYSYAFAKTDLRLLKTETLIAHILITSQFL